VGSAGLGAVIGTAFLTTRPTVFDLSRLVPFTSAAAGIALMLVGVSKIYWVSLAFMACLGFGIIVTAASVNMMLQTVVEEDKRGRVMSLFTMAFMATVPLGALVAGAIASRFGFHTMVWCCAGWCLLVSLAFASQMPRLRRETRPIYVQRGILESEDEVELITKPAA
jgi:predicted MFS family arabinose efflux permease